MSDRRNLYVGTVVAAVLAIVVGVVFALSRDSDRTGKAPSTVPEGVTAQYGVVVGEPDAPTTLVFYEDPQCPVCRAFEDAVGTQVADAVAAGKVSVEYRVVSFLDSASTNAYSSRAANALLAVQDTAGEEAFAAMHQLLYDHQPEEGGPGPDDDQLVEWAVKAGADESVVRPLVEDGAFDQWIVNATDAMSKAGVNGTPTVFIDGTLAGATPQESVDAVLAALD